jgi:hypothetical protein
MSHNFACFEKWWHLISWKKTIPCSFCCDDSVQLFWLNTSIAFFAYHWLKSWPSNNFIFCHAFHCYYALKADQAKNWEGQGTTLEKVDNGKRHSVKKNLFLIKALKKHMCLWSARTSVPARAHPKKCFFYFLTHPVIRQCHLANIRGTTTSRMFLHLSFVTFYTLNHE